MFRQQWISNSKINKFSKKRDNVASGTKENEDAVAVPHYKVKDDLDK